MNQTEVFAVGTMVKKSKAGAKKRLLLAGECARVNGIEAVCRNDCCRDNRQAVACMDAIDLHVGEGAMKDQ